MCYFQIKVAIVGMRMSALENAALHVLEELVSAESPPPPPPSPQLAVFGPTPIVFVGLILSVLAPLMYAVKASEEWDSSPDSWYDVCPWWLISAYGCMATAYAFAASWPEAPLASGFHWCLSSAAYLLCMLHMRRVAEAPRAASRTAWIFYAAVLAFVYTLRYSGAPEECPVLLAMLVSSMLLMTFRFYRKWRTDTSQNSVSLIVRRRALALLVFIAFTVGVQNSCGLCSRPPSRRAGAWVAVGDGLVMIAATDIMW